MLSLVGIWIGLIALLVAGRYAGVRNIDEDGYLAMAISDYFSGIHGGLVGWVAAVLNPGIQAPLTSAAASLLFFVTGPSFLAAMSVIVASTVATVILTLAIARRAGGPIVVVISTVLVMTLPGLLELTRLFVFAVPATAVLLGATYALIRSRQLTSIPWAFAFGGLVGLLPLTRTMTVAFIPGFVAAVLLQLTLIPERRGRRMLLAAASAITAFVVAAIWLIGSGDRVLGYLTGFGYGQQAAEFASGAESPFSAVITALTKTMYLPHFLIITAAWIVAAIVVIQRVRSTGFRSTTLAAARSPLMILAIVPAVGALVVASSQNAGLGFSLPIVPPAVIVAGWAIGELATRIRSRGARWPLVAALLATPVILSVGAWFPTGPLSQPRDVTIPGVGPVTLTQGKPGVYGQLEEDEQSISDGRSAWIVSSENFFRAIWSKAPDADLSVAFGFRHRFFHTNALLVESLETTGYPIAQSQVDPLTEPTVSGYVDWLTTGSASSTCWLLTSRGEVNEFLPLIDTPDLERAAEDTGFEQSSTQALPDGRIVIVWMRPAAC